MKKKTSLGLKIFLGKGHFPLILISFLIVNPSKVYLHVNYYYLSHLSNFFPIHQSHMLFVHSR